MLIIPSQLSVVSAGECREFPSNDKRINKKDTERDVSDFHA